MQCLLVSKKQKKPVGITIEQKLDNGFASLKDTAPFRCKCSPGQDILGAEHQAAVVV